jgi:zinc transport system substrate-binding protein
MRQRTYALIAVLVVLILLGTILGLYLSNQPAPSTNSKLKVVATFYPLYDFAQNVGGNKTDVSILVPETVDVHAFEPTPSSIAEVASANVLIYNGAGLEPWIQDVISAAGNTKLIQVDTSQGINTFQYHHNFKGVTKQLTLTSGLIP